MPDIALFGAPRRAHGFGLVIEGQSRPVERAGAYPRGARIFHQKFGYGTVTSAEGDKLDIEFDKAGGKKVLASFVVVADKAG
jgi:DNA helicase-2/ATP-dependent DNA helicase PcrA